MVGMALVILGSLGDFSALGLAAQSIVAPVSAITLVANLFFAHYFLGEQLGKLDVIGSLTILVGCVLAVMFGSRQSGDVTTKKLQQNFTEVPFIIYIIITLSIVCGIYYKIKQLDKL